MKSALIFIAPALIAPALFAQTPTEEVTQGQVDAQVQSDVVVPATPGTEEAPRFSNRVPVGADSYVEMPMPEYSKRHHGPLEAVTVDLADGSESRIALPTDPFSLQQFIAGREMTSAVGEPSYDNFGSLSSITSQAFPWSTQVRMFFTQAGLNYVCSGTMIDPKYVITAGHCVHQGSGGAWSTNVSVAPAWDGDNGAFGSSSATSLGSFTGWTVSGSYDGDMGFVRLARPVGFLTGWLGTFYNSSNSFWSGTTFNMAGYPGGCFAGAPNRLYYGAGTWNTVGTNVCEAVMNAPCWIGGMSGSGIYYIDGSGNRYVGANLSHGWGKAQGITTRIGVCRMTQSKFDWFHNTFKPGGYPTASVDYVPLQVRVGNTVIKRGTKPTSMNYKVYNVSSFDPANAVVDMDVYLSSNDLITTFDTKLQDHSFTWNFGPKTGVTVNVSNPPTIPAATAPGTWFLGVIVDEVDFNTSNNKSDGWDAARITVTL